MRRGSSCFLLATSLVAAWLSLAFTVNRTETGQLTRWREGTIAFWADEAGSPDFSGDGEFTAVAAAMEPWNAVTCGGEDLPVTLRYAGEAPGLTVSYDETGGTNRNVVLWVQDREEWEHGSLVLALTRNVYYQDTGEIVDSDIEVADFAWSFGDVTKPGQRRRIDLQAALTHEFGHVLGLDHSTDPTASLYPSAEPGEVTKRHLAADDIEGVCSLYGPGAPPLPQPGSLSTRGGRNSGDDDGGCSAAGGPARAGGSGPGGGRRLTGRPAILVLVVLLLRLRTGRRSGPGAGPLRALTPGAAGSAGSAG